jgi:excisionase family DNA binding protein
MLTVKEAAKYLRISDTKCYELASKKKVAHYRVGGKILFQESDLAAYLSSCRVEVEVPAAHRVVSAPLRHLKLNSAG